MQSPEPEKEFAGTAVEAPAWGCRETECHALLAGTVVRYGALVDTSLLFADADDGGDEDGDGNIEVPRP